MFLQRVVFFTNRINRNEQRFAHFSVRRFHQRVVRNVRCSGRKTRRNKKQEENKKRGKKADATCHQSTFISSIRRPRSSSEKYWMTISPRPDRPGFTCTRVERCEAILSWMRLYS